MNTTKYLATGLALTSFGLSAMATTYNGNGNTGFGGPIGLGSLSLTDNGTTISGTITKGPNGFNDVLVLYIDSISGGFASTAGFSDAGDGLRKAISGFDGSNRSQFFARLCPGARTEQRQFWRSVDAGQRW